jgi:predicted DNA-binding transcriptional regulator YafY
MDKLRANFKLMLIIEEIIKKNNEGISRLNLYEATKKHVKKDFSISKFDKIIKSMKQDFNAPIIQNKSKSYLYKTQNFCIEKADDFSEEDINIFKMMIPFFKTLKNDDFSNDLNNFLSKINFDKNITKPIISFESPVNIEYAEKMAMLYEYIEKKKVLSITYEDYDKPLETFIFSPFLLKEYRNRWYLVGFNHHSDMINVLGLDRIKKTQLIKGTEYSNYNFNEEEYFKNSLGNTRPNSAKTREIILKFNKLNKNYILSNPIHKTQKIISETEDTLTISLRLYDSHELRMLLLSYGSGVEVLKPNFYREYLKKIANQVLEIYK